MFEDLQHVDAGAQFGEAESEVVVLGQRPSAAARHRRRLFGEEVERDLQPRRGGAAAALERTEAQRADLDSHAIDLLARQSPVATDLRTIVTSMRMSADLERMGDLARHVAKLARLRYPEHAVPDEVRPTIQQMSEVCARIIDEVEGCLQTQGLQAVDEIDRVDDELDELHRDLYSRLVDGHWTHGTESAVDMALLGRYYERFGDHGVSIGHRVRFLVTGEQPAGDLTD